MQVNMRILSNIYTKYRLFVVVPLILAVGGCAGFSPSSNETAGGINPDYIFGDRRPGTGGSLIDDSVYAEYLEWKQWQDFQAYQKWKSLRGDQEN